MEKKETYESWNIFQRLNGITAEMMTVKKNLDVQTSKYSSYKAVSERDILDAVKPLEAKYRVYSFPYERNIIEKDFLTVKGQNGERTQFYIRAQVTYRFINIDKPEEFIDITSWGDGIDSGDKCVGKAMTYADKYALMKAYKISTGDDPDQEASKEYEKPKKAAKKEPEQEEPVDELLQELNEWRSKLSQIGVDVHNPDVSVYISQLTKVKNLDHGALFMNPAEGIKVLDAYKKIYEKKKKG
ncbi:MAG: hypothetical protein E7185_09930 [Erysipelotrichaceae bacterium]|nr:hypothetical protein [Erysipelotrichaceae bacterium]